jgi:hypothetical protein
MTHLLFFALVLIAILCTTPLLLSQSPYKLSWNKDGYIAGAGTITGFSALALDRSVHSLTPMEVSQLSRESVNWFDRGATFRYSPSASQASDVLYTLAFASPTVLFADQSIRKDLPTITLMYLEVFGWVGSATAAPSFRL